MTREIKFRAWDISNNEMYQVGTLEFEKATGDLATTYDPVMQYIGLKDKNSKEIYEGDIVILNIGHKYVVEYSQLNAWFCLVQVTTVDGRLIDKVYTGGISGQELKFCEVIGNIYQDKELLKI